MSVKRLELEYSQVVDQYHEMIENLKDIKKNSVKV